MLELQTTTEQKLDNIHPGVVLYEDFLKPLNMSLYKLSISIGVPQTRIGQIVKQKRGISADTAIRLSRFFGTSAEFWLNLQNMYDIEREKENNQETFDSIKLYNYA